MWLKDKWHAYRMWQAKRYLARYNELALNVLRADPGLATQAVFQAQMMDAVKGDPERRSIQFPVLGQLGMGARNVLGLTLPKTSPINLRRFSEYPPSRQAINAIKNPILEQNWVIEPVPDPDMSKHEDNIPTTEQHKRILALYNVLTRPNNEDSYRVWVGQVLEDMIVGGYGASEVAQTNEDDRPAFLWPVDGQSVRINVHWDGTPGAMRYSQSLAYAGISVGTHEWVQLKDDELLYFRLTPRSNTPFGFGYLETAYTAINAYIGAFEYAERRASNATPNFALFLGENVTVDQVRRFQQYWQQSIEGYAAVPMFGGGRSPQVLPFTGAGEDALFLKWQEWLVRVIAMSFGLSPMRLAIERDVNRSTAESADAQDWETVAPVANGFADYFTYKLIWQILGWTDLRFRWLVKDTDEKRQAEILREQWESDSITVNEQRRFWERPPLPTPLGDLTKTAYEEAIKAASQRQTLPPDMGEPPAQEEDDGAFPPVTVDEEEEEQEEDRMAAARQGRLQEAARRVLREVELSTNGAHGP